MEDPTLGNVVGYVIELETKQRKDFFSLFQDAVLLAVLVVYAVIFYLETSSDDLGMLAFFLFSCITTLEHKRPVLQELAISILPPSLLAACVGYAYDSKPSPLLERMGHVSPSLGYAGLMPCSLILGAITSGMLCELTMHKTN